MVRHSFSRARRVRLHARDFGRCGLCQQPVSVDEAHVDHIIAVALGGDNRDTNLRIAHPSCNREAGQRLRVFLQQLRALGIPRVVARRRLEVALAPMLQELAVRRALVVTQAERIGRLEAELSAAAAATRRRPRWQFWR